MPQAAINAARAEVASRGWWWERSEWLPRFLMEEGRVPQPEEQAQSVRSYWDAEVLRPTPPRRATPARQPGVEAEFPTDELDDDELAELGRALLRAGDGDEARARATRTFFENRKPKTLAVQGAPPPKAPPGSAAWMKRLAAKRDELFRDKKSLASRQAKRAEFLANVDDAGDIAEARDRERLSRRRLDDLKSRRHTPVKPKRRVSFAIPDEDDLETRAAVDLHWKQI